MFEPAWPPLCVESHELDIRHISRSGADALVRLLGYQASFELLQSIPGVQELAAAALVAEAGADMSVFPSPRRS